MLGTHAAAKSSSTKASRPRGPTAITAWLCLGDWFRFSRPASDLHKPPGGLRPHAPLIPTTAGMGCRTLIQDPQRLPWVRKAHGSSRSTGGCGGAVGWGTVLLIKQGRRGREGTKHVCACVSWGTNKIRKPCLQTARTHNFTGTCASLCPAPSCWDSQTRGE